MHAVTAEILKHTDKAFQSGIHSISLFIELSIYLYLYIVSFPPSNLMDSFRFPLLLLLCIVAIILEPLHLLYEYKNSYNMLFIDTPGLPYEVETEEFNQIAPYLEEVLRPIHRLIICVEGISFFYKKPYILSIPFVIV